MKLAMLDSSPLTSTKQLRIISGFKLQNNDNWEVAQPKVKPQYYLPSFANPNWLIVTARSSSDYFYFLFFANLNNNDAGKKETARNET